ncbi:MAG: hypothetical protein WC802_00505 [Patescibacteria group bacterium]|jgi:hypothetical protein
MFLQMLALSLLSAPAQAGGKPLTVDVDNVRMVTDLVPDLYMDDPWSRSSEDPGDSLPYKWSELMRPGEWDQLVLRSDPDKPTIHQLIGPAVISFRLIPAESVDLHTTGEIQAYWTEQGWRWPTIRELLVISQLPIIRDVGRVNKSLITMAQAETVSGPIDLAVEYEPFLGFQPRLNFFDCRPDKVFPVSRKKHEAFFVAVIP